MDTIAAPDWWTLSLAQWVLELAATVAFALSGVLAAARARLDAVGVCLVAGVSAFGGGTVRDLLLDRRPFFWVAHDYQVWVVFVVCIGAMAFLRSKHFHPTERAMQWPDAIGLGLFCASGTQLALAAQMPALLAVLMGVITGVFGGVLRDVMCNEVPVAFRDHRPYAICGFAGGWVVVGAQALQAPAWIELVGGALLATTLRALALRFDWQIPAWDHDDRPGPGSR